MIAIGVWAGVVFSVMTMATMTMNKDEVIKYQDEYIVLLERETKKKSMLLAEKGIFPTSQEKEEGFLARELVRLAKL